MGQEWGFLRWNGELMGVSVRGECPKCGHQVQTEAPRDRVTWRGPCPVDGCVTRVIARRISPDGTGRDGYGAGGDRDERGRGRPGDGSGPGNGPGPGQAEAVERPAGAS